MRAITISRGCGIVRGDTHAIIAHSFTSLANLVQSALRNAGNFRRDFHDDWID